MHRQFTKFPAIVIDDLAFLAIYNAAGTDYKAIFPEHFDFVP